MMSLLTTINEENDKIKKNQQSKILDEKATSKAGQKMQRRMKINAFIREIKDSVEAHKREYEFQVNCQKSFDDFLNLSKNSNGKSGIESYVTDEGLSKIIFTRTIGPFSKIQLPENTNANEESCYLYEGFAKNENGFYEYYNLSVKKVLNPLGKSIKQIKGFSVDPGNKLVTKIDAETHDEITFIEQHFIDLEKEYSPKEKTND